MDSHVFSRTLAPATYGVHVDRAQFLGSNKTNANAAYGYIEHVKRRWTQQVREYEDAGALDRFGIDPTKPVPLGVTVTADPYGYPIDGYTTGYTVKLPPPADIVAAQNTPKSFNVPAIVQRGNGDETMAPPPLPEGETVVGPDQEPANTAGWQYGQNSGMKSTAELAKLARDMQDLVTRSGVDPATAAQALMTMRARSKLSQDQVVPSSSTSGSSYAASSAGSTGSSGNQMVPG